MAIELQKQTISMLCERWNKNADYILGLAREEKLPLWVEVTGVIVVTLGAEKEKPTSGGKNEESTLVRLLGKYEIKKGTSALIQKGFEIKIDYAMLLRLMKRRSITVQELVGQDSDGAIVVALSVTRFIQLKSAEGWLPLRAKDAEDITVDIQSLYAQLPDVKALDKEFFDAGANSSTPVEQQSEGNSKITLSELKTFAEKLRKVEKDQDVIMARLYDEHGARYWQLVDIFSITLPVTSKAKDPQKVKETMARRSVVKGRKTLKGRSEDY
jgi:hypothetical protein